MNNFQKTILALTVFLWLTLGSYLIVSFWLDNPQPFFIVASQSMFPTLEQGDLILVKGCSIAFVNDIVVFESPRRFQTETTRLIVHRVIKTESINGTVYYKTKGDNNPYPDEWTDYRGSAYAYNGMVSNKLLIGKVVYVIPQVGKVMLFAETPNGIGLILLLLAIGIITEILTKKK
jgi:signal peptidase I